LVTPRTTRGKVLKYRLVLRAIDAHDLSWMLHIGDIFWRPCTDDHYWRALGRFNSLRHPVIYSPGDPDRPTSAGCGWS